MMLETERAMTTESQTYQLPENFKIYKKKTRSTRYRMATYGDIYKHKQAILDSIGNKNLMYDGGIIVGGNDPLIRQGKFSKGNGYLYIKRD